MQCPTIELSTTFDGLLEGLQILDADLRYLYLNETAARHGRTTRGALLGRCMAECYPGVEDTAMYAQLRRCLVDRTPRTMENEFTFPDGSTGTFELRIEPVPQGICVLSLDITTRKRAEERLRMAERMEAIGQLAAGIAHDFNNLLSVLISQAEIARTRPGGPTVADMEAVLATAYTSAALTKQLLAYGRRSVVTREPIDVRDIVLNLAPVMRRALSGSIELRVDMPPELDRVEGDRVQIQQVVMNLVLNARDAITGVGKITVTAGIVDLHGAVLVMHPDTQPGRYVVLTISDTGKGMDAATRERLFDPFFTTKEPGRGTGLGLATVFGIVRQHGGSIWVYSEPAAGSTFKVYLPASSGAQPVRTPPPVLTVEPATGAVIVAEDSPLIRALVEAVLTEAGFDVRLAANGIEALDHFEREPDRIALLVTDMTMPNMNGAALIEAVRRVRPMLPVICTSGHSDHELAARGLLPSRVVFVQKPFAPHALLEHVRALVASRRAE